MWKMLDEKSKVTKFTGNTDSENEWLWTAVADSSVCEVWLEDYASFHFW